MAPAVRAAALAALVSVACSARPRGAPRPVATPSADARPEVPASAPTARPGPIAPFALASEFRERLATLGADEPSLGHGGGRWRARTFGDAGGARAFAGGDAPAGALLVVELLGPVEGDDGPLLAMEKLAPGADPRAGDYRYAVLDRDARTLRAGHLADCVACHATAGPGRVFGARRAAAAR